GRLGGHIRRGRGRARFPKGRGSMARRRPQVPHTFRGHVLDEFQIQAAIAIQQDMSTLVSAPTGTGKSLIADYLVDDMLRQGRRVVYTAPIKALVNQKYREFRDLYGGARTGILTGDLSLNPGAPLVVMTTEVLRNRLLAGPGGEGDDRDAAGSSRPGIDADWVVFDEIHYIDHPQRGTVWEEAMLLLPPGCRILGLSATVPNIGQIAAWLESVYGEPVATIVHTERAVPLRHRYFTDTGQLVDYAALWQHLTGHDLKAGTVSVAETGPPARRELAGRRRAAQTPPRDSTHLELVAYMQRHRRSEERRVGKERRQRRPGTHCTEAI